MGIVPVLSFVPIVLIIYPEATMTSFLLLVSHKGHSRAIVAVFVWWPKHGTKQ